MEIKMEEVGLMDSTEEFFDAFGIDKKLMPLKRYQLIKLLCLKEHYDDELDLEDVVLSYFTERKDKLDAATVEKIKKIFWI